MYIGIMTIILIQEKCLTSQFKAIRYFSVYEPPFRVRSGEVALNCPAYKDDRNHNSYHYYNHMLATCLGRAKRADAAPWSSARHLAHWCLECPSLA